MPHRLDALDVAVRESSRRCRSTQVKRVARAAGDGAAVDVVQASTDEEVTRAARRRARINERDRADAAAARAARERFFRCPFPMLLVLPRIRSDDRPRSLRPSPRRRRRPCLLRVPDERNTPRRHRRGPSP